MAIDISPYEMAISLSGEPSTSLACPDEIIDYLIMIKKKKARRTQHHEAPFESEVEGAGNSNRLVLKTRNQLMISSGLTSPTPPRDSDRRPVVFCARISFLVSPHLFFTRDRESLVSK